MMIYACSLRWIILLIVSEMCGLYGVVWYKFYINKPLQAIKSFE